MLGSTSINIFGVLSDSDTTILLNYRIPKALTALLSGIGLSLCGVVMQTVFRNPLAGPYVLGVSAGGSLGVALFMLGGGILGFLGDIGIASAAFLGSVCVMFLVLAISTRLRDIMAVLILGMMIGSATSAFVDLLQYFSSESALKGFVVWAMGSVGGVSYPQVLIILCGCVVGVGLIVLKIKGLDAMVLGENYVRTLGINIHSTRLVLFISTALMAGVITAFCGPIAFIGIAVPHISRILFRTSIHRVLLPACGLVGGAVMLLCDIISTVPFSQTVLPINTTTALFGIPVVVLVVIRSRSGKLM